MKNKNKKYYIYLNHSSSIEESSGYREVEGKRCLLKGWEHLDTFLHKSIDYPDRWVISEGRTGASVSYACGRKLQREAKEEAIERVRYMGSCDIEKQLTSIINTQGISPRYYEFDEEKI